MSSIFTLPATSQLLTEGGDSRITLNASTGLNKYGCLPYPDPDLFDFGSSTASSISEQGYLAADQLRQHIVSACTTQQAEQVYQEEFSRIRDQLVQLCGLENRSDIALVFAASGTDTHRIAARIASCNHPASTLAIMIAPAETGSGVKSALSANAGRETYPCCSDIACIEVRQQDGKPMSDVEIAHQVEEQVTQAIALGQHLLVVLTDVSKTGMIEPSPTQIAALQQRWPDHIDVLVDACQFRICENTFQYYLDLGFMVAVTGSKFLNGPAFSGALFLPSTLAKRLYPIASSIDLHASNTPDKAAMCWIPNPANKLAGCFGQLLRWKAALTELQAFKKVPADKILAFTQLFASTIQQRLASDAALAIVNTPALVRENHGQNPQWDSIPTIFTFVIFQQNGNHDQPLSKDQIYKVYALLGKDLSDHFDEANTPDLPALAKIRAQLGQPVKIGNDGLNELFALRLCLSAKLIVEATVDDGKKQQQVIDRALTVLDKTTFITKNVLHY